MTVKAVLERIMRVKAVADVDREERLTESLRKHEEAADRKAMARDCYQLGVLCQETGRLHDAEAMHRRALVLCLSLKDGSGVAAAYSSLGLLYEMYGDIGQARFFLEEARGTHQGGQEGPAEPPRAVAPLGPVMDMAVDVEHFRSVVHGLPLYDDSWRSTWTSARLAIWPMPWPSRPSAIERAENIPAL